MNGSSGQWGLDLLQTLAQPDMLVALLPLASVPYSIFTLYIGLHK